MYKPKGKALVKKTVCIHDIMPAAVDDYYKPDKYVDTSSEEFDSDQSYLEDEQNCDDYLYDCDNPKMYIVNAKMINGNIFQNQKHSCFKCNEMVLHLGEHLKIHKGDNEVDAILASKENHEGKDSTAKRISAQELYRNRGGRHPDMKVLREKQGELIVSHRPFKNFRSDDFGLCPKCL